MTIEQTRLWRTGLDDQAFTDQSTARNRFRQALDRARETAGKIAGEIPRDLPDFTQHDLSHMDALWELADDISGGSAVHNPAEAFVFGMAVLVHDLAMSEAANVLTGSRLRSHPGWPDALSKRLRQEFRRPPTPAELVSPPDGLAVAAEKELIRALHAERAESLPTAEWERLDRSHGYLIEDGELRATYGHVIGQIAASHHWDRSLLPAAFAAPLGAPAFAPTSWRVDALVLACLLRTSDAAHLDAGRTPDVLAAARGIEGESRNHWVFQSRLQRPYAQGDRLVFTAPAGFDRSEIGAWWLAYDTLTMVDRELHGVAAILGDAGRSTFQVTGVAHVDSPQSCRALLPCHGWEPVPARVQVSDVSALVRRLGGSGLYGDNAVVAVRELLMNACDAVEASRAMCDFLGRRQSANRVDVRLRRDTSGLWLDVSDLGIGMSPSVLAGPLLDFGKSSWLADDVARDNPGLIASRFQPVGRFGIGFFAVFMLGKTVRVLSRPRTGGPSDTYVLEFAEGVGHRPVLRQADPEERRDDPGTTVSVLVDQAHTQDDHLRLWFKQGGRYFASSIALTSLKEVVQQVMPASTVDVWTAEVDQPEELSLEANDWLTIPGTDLLTRSSGMIDDRKEGDDFKSLAGQLEVLHDEDDRPVARIALLGRDQIERLGWAANDYSQITAGPARTDTGVYGLAGILIGDPARASRDAAVPRLTPEALGAWATDAAARVVLSSDPAGSHEWVRAFADALDELGADTSLLPRWYTGRGWLDTAQLIDMIRDHDVVRLVHPLYEDVRVGDATTLVALAEDVVCFEVGRRSATGVRWPLPADQPFEMGGTLGAFARAVAEAWDIPVEVVTDLYHAEPVGQVIGTHDGSEVRAPASVMRRPERGT